MAWNTPRTFTTGEIITATILNTNIRDNLNASAAGVASGVGDVFYANAPNAIVPLALGSVYQQLMVNRPPHTTPSTFRCLLLSHRED